MNNNTGRKRVRRARKNTGSIKRILLTICLMVMVATVSVVGTIAYLTDSTQSVTNTFAPSGIGVTLTESGLKPTPTQNYEVEEDYTDPAEGTTNTYKIIPGKTYKKDPTVAIESDTDVPVYLFVKYEEVGNPSTYYTYTSTLNTDNGWNLVDGTTNVWYRTVNPTDTTTSWELLVGQGEEGGVFYDGYITVKDTVLETDMDNAKAASLKWTAYAIQTEGLTVANAWTEVSKLDANNP